MKRKDEINNLNKKTVNQLNLDLKKAQKEIKIIILEIKAKKNTNNHLIGAKKRSIARIATVISQKEMDEK